MFSLKVQDFLSEQVTTSIQYEAAPLPRITICPGSLSKSFKSDMKAAWKDGNVTTEEIFTNATLDLRLALIDCSTFSNHTCMPGSAGGGFGWGRWELGRQPLGSTCFTLITELRPEDISEVRVELRLLRDYLGTNGFYKVFLHGDGTAKTFYGGDLVSSYHLIQRGTKQELSITVTQTVQVNRRRNPCEENANYDRNKVRPPRLTPR